MRNIVALANWLFHIIYLFHKNKIINYFKGKINPKVIFDVGAYKGAFGNSFKNCKVFFFEPNIYAFTKIKKIKNNKYYNLALGCEYKNETLNIRPNHSASTINKQIKKEFKDYLLDFLGQKKIVTNIKVYPLNFFIKKNSIKKIDILKIDVEGYEEEVLKGISKKNFKKIKFIVIEKLLNEQLYHNYSFKRIHKIITKNNFINVSKFKDLIWNYEDHIYQSKKNI
jgi:FkbM family methyltransferase